MTYIPLLLEETPDAIQRKLGGAEGKLRTYVDHFLALAREDRNWFGRYQPLAWMITKDRAFVDNTRDMFLRFVELQPEGELSQEAQLHTHVVSAPLGRLAAMYDWIADADILSSSEKEAVEAAMLRHAWLFGMQQLHGRTLTGFDNQVMSNAFCCAAVGTVLGERRRRDPLARRLQGLGLAWLRKLFLLMPPGAYSLEGSTYNEHVATPVMLWSTILYEQLTGESIFFSGLPSGTPSPHKMLDCLYRQVSPTGFLPPWDAYGWQRLSVRMLLTYLARRTGNADPLRVLRDTDTWHILDLAAWECDDRAWALAWWPEGLDWENGTPRYDAWMQPLTGGALQDRKTRTRLFQYWDQTGGMPHCGRAEVNPNAITLEAFGTPLLMDGAGMISEDLTAIPTDVVCDYAPDVVDGLLRGRKQSGDAARANAAKRAVGGFVGMSNSLHFDGEDWYCPKRRAHGKGESCYSAGPLQVITSDATEYYTDRYDVTRVRRISAMLAGRWTVTMDQVMAETEHDVTWQVFAAPDVQVHDKGIRAVTPDGVGLLIASEGGKPSVDAAPEFPKRAPYGQGSSRIRFAGKTQDGRYERAFCLLPYEHLKPLPIGVNTSWAAVYGDVAKEDLDLRDAMLLDSGIAKEDLRIFRRDVELKEVLDSAFLRLAYASPQTVCRVNGTEAPHPCNPPSERWEREVGPLSPGSHLFDLSGLLTSGTNTIELEAPYFHGETLAGPAVLLTPGDVPALDVRDCGDRLFEITVDGEPDMLMLANKGGERSVADMTTDALHAAVAANRAIAAMQATTVRSKTLKFASQQPVDIGVSHDDVITIELDQLVSNNRIAASLDGVELRVESSGWLNVSLTGTAADRVRLRVRSAEARPLSVNGKDCGWVAANTWHTITASSAVSDGALQPPPSSPTSAPATTEPIAGDLLPCCRAYDLAAAADEDALLEMTASNDWTEQLTAVDALSIAGTAACGSRLLDLLQTELALDPDPPLRCWWRGAKMLHAAGPVTPDPNIEHPAGVKRWRLRLALVHALGCIGYAEATSTLRDMLKADTDYYCLTAQVPVALARLNATEAIPDLEAQWHHPEVNTQVAIQLAVQYLKDEISRHEFEQRIGPG